MRLTDLSIKALNPPESGARIYHDDFLTGFGVRVTAHGVKSFVLTHGTLRQRETIGRVGILTLQEARSEAKRRLAEYTLGKATPATISWNAALETYLGEVAEKRKPRTHADYTRLLKKHFRFGDTKLPDITPAMIDGKLRKLSSTPAEQQHAFVVLRAFVKWCYRKSYIDRNPMDRMEEPKGYQARDRVLTDEELRNVWKALEDSTFGRIVKLLILTGQRETEVAHLTPDMLAGDTITLPSWLTKNNREHRFPVGKTAQFLLRSDSAPVSQATSSLLFPARGTTEKLFNGWSKCKTALDKRSGVSDWRLHDLRRTFRTKWEELGIQPTVAERYINHISGEHAGIRRTYNRYDYMREMQEAAATWEDHLLTITSADYSNIVPIRKLTSRA